ncbi:MAG: helix-turn-helix transcriptional regulator [Provencibacterium sp.]|jgi:two-component system response regulator YesN|nr:helix-turn-helix transcriptional regulator [Provencibacterium sp.]
MPLTNLWERLKAPRSKLGRLFYSYLSMLLVPILISSAAYIRMEQMVRGQSIRIVETAVEQMGEELDRALQEAETLANAMISNRRVKICANANKPSSSTSVYDLLEMSYDLRNYGLGLSNISDFFLYFPKSDVIMTRSASYSPSLFFQHIYGSSSVAYEEFYEETLNGYYRGSILHSRVESRGQGKEALLYALTLPGAEAGSVGANIFLLLDVASLQDSFRGFADIMPGSKAVLFQSRSQEALLCFSTLSEPEEAVRREFEEGVHLQSGYLASRLSSQTGKGLEYIIWQPVRTVLDPVRRIRNFLLAAIACYMLVGIFMSYFLSEKARAPVKSLFGAIQPLLHMKAASPRRDYRQDLKLIEEGVFHLAAQNESASRRLNEMLPVVRNNVLNKLLAGDWAGEARPSRFLEKYALQLDEPWFFVLILMLDTADGAEAGSELAAAAGIACAHASAFSHCYCAEPASRQVCLIVNHVRPVEDAEILQLAHAIRNELFYRMNLDASAYTGTCGEGLGSIARSYHEALQALHYRAVIPGSSVIEYRGLARGSSPVHYGAEAELGLQNALREGDLAKAQLGIDRLFEEHALERSMDPYMAHCLVIRLLLTLIEAGESVGYSLYNDPPLQPVIRGLFPLDARMEETNEILKQIAGRLCGYVCEHRDRTLKSLRERAEEIIAQEIANPELSQTYLAQQLGVSAPYLSAFFKEKMGQNMVDYINRRRCGLARRYLSETDWTLSEIASQVGLADSAAVIRIFKKYCGMTPGQFRKQLDSARR